MGTTASPPTARRSPVRDWVPFGWIALPGIAVAVISAVTRRPRLHGHAVRPAEEPELATLVRQVAERLGFRRPGPATRVTTSRKTPARCHLRNRP